MKTPYDYYQEEMQKQALLGVALRSAANIVTMPGLANLAGQGVKLLGRGIGVGRFDAAAGAFKGNGFRARVAQTIHNAGSSVVNQADRLQGATNSFMNKGPGFNYNIHKLPELAKKPMRFLGMQVDNPENKMTLQRAAVWGGNALITKDMVDSFSPPKQPEPTSVTALNPVKAAAIIQAQVDFAALVERLEG